MTAVACMTARLLPGYCLVYLIVFHVAVFPLLPVCLMFIIVLDARRSIGSCPYYPIGVNYRPAAPRPQGGFRTPGPLNVGSGPHGIAAVHSR